MLKMIKVQINLEVKGDPVDDEDFKDRLFDKLQLLIENDELDYNLVEEDDDDFEVED